MLSFSYHFFISNRYSAQKFGEVKKLAQRDSKPGPTVDVSLIMTRAGIFTMISRVVVVRYLGGLLCAVGPMASLFNLSSLHPSES